MLKKLWSAIKEYFTSKEEEEVVVSYKAPSCKTSFTGPEYWAQRAMEIRNQLGYKQVVQAPSKSKSPESEYTFHQEVKRWRENNAAVDRYFAKRNGLVTA